MNIKIDEFLEQRTPKLKSIHLKISINEEVEEAEDGSDGHFCEDYEIENTNRRFKNYRCYFHPNFFQDETAARLFLILIQFDDELDKIELSKSLKEKDLILASITHDMRTPLNAIQDALENIKVESINKEENDMMRGAVTSCKLLRFLIQDIIDAAKLINTGKVVLNPTRTSLDDIFADVFSIMKSKFEEKDLGIETIIEDSVPETVITDEQRLKQIILNFLSNSLKFTQRGKVTLTARLFKGSSDLIDIIIKDTGVGIKESDQKRISERFFTAGGNLNKQGVGLGLSICKKLAGLLGPQERINFYSKYGKGSKFWIRIYSDLENKSQYTFPFISIEDRWDENNIDNSSHEPQIQEYGETFLGDNLTSIYTNRKVSSHGYYSYLEQSEEDSFEIEVFLRLLIECLHVSK